MNAIQQEVENNHSSFRIKRNNQIKSCSNISQGALTPTSPVYTKVRSRDKNKDENSQTYSKTILKIFQTVNQNKQSDLKLDSKFTRTCTRIPSFKDYNNKQANLVKEENGSSSQYNQIYKIQQQIQNLNGLEINNASQFNCYNNFNNFSTQSPQNAQTTTNIQSKDNNNTSLEQSKERQSSQIMSKFQLFQTYQSALSSKRNSIGGGRVNWLSFQNKQYRSTNGSMTCQEQMMQIKNISQTESIPIQIQGNQVNGQRQNQELSSTTTINNSLSRQQLADDVKTPTSCDTLNMQLPSMSATSKSNHFYQQNYQNSNQNNTFTFSGRCKQISLKNYQKNSQKISSFNDYMRVENSQKIPGNEYIQLKKEYQQTPKQQSSNQYQREKIQEQYPISPKGISFNSVPISNTNIQNFNDGQQSSNKTLQDKLSPLLRSSLVLDQKRQSVQDSIDMIGSTTTQRIVQQQQVKHRSLDNQENRPFNANKLSLKQDSQDEQNIMSIVNKSSPKYAFKKAQIFQTKQEIKTKEIKVYDDSLKIQRRSSRGINEYELIQLPFYRKRVVVVNDSNSDSRSLRMTTNEKNNTDTSISQKVKTLEQQHMQLPMDQFLKCSEFISSNKNEQQNQQIHQSQFYSPLHNYKYHSDIDFKKNLQDKQINQLIQKQKESQLQKGVNLNKIKQAFNQAQSDTIMGLISPENKYQTNRYSKHYQKFMHSQK